MSEDVFQKHKITRHTNLIPNRQLIVKYLVQHEKPVNLKSFATALNIKGKEQTEAFRQLLRAMERDGQLVFTHHHGYTLPEHLNLIKGIVIGHRDGYGFLRVEGFKHDFYLSYEQMKSCIHGDHVLAQAINQDQKNRKEAQIIRILKSKNSQIVGRYFTHENMSFVIPNDSRLNFNIFIPSEDVMEVHAGFLVVVKLIKRPTRYTRAVGKIIEVLGNNMGINMAIDIALRTHEIPHIWPKAIENQIKHFKNSVTVELKTNRIDLRNLPLVTIDSEDAHDFDDAVYCEKKQNGDWCLWVAIADVSYYVRPYTPLDKEARNRGTSIYFPSQVIPMLPELLSNELCSLNPQVDRLCMVCEMTISANGYLTGYNFYEAVMNSHARLTYNKVFGILQGDQELRKQYIQLLNNIEELYNLYKVLHQARMKRGSILFEHNGEVKFIFNTEQQQHIKYIEQEHRNFAHKIIEECMILTNLSAALFVEKANEPALYRIHDKPTIEDINSFRAILAALGIQITLSNNNMPNYTELLESTANHPYYEIIQTMLIRSMKQAIYYPENRGHFGLALQSYAHFTSPIRRYSDLLLHRIIKHLLNLRHKQNINGHNDITGGWHYSMEEMFQLGQHCSMTERRADEATREVTDWLKCDFMIKNIGNIFKGIIFSVTNFGLFIRLEEYPIEGLIHISNLNNSNCYYFDQDSQCLISESCSQTYRLGDRVKVRLKAVNMDERKLDFNLVS